MAKFKFRLATLLRLREATRDERRRQLAEAYQADDLLNERIDEVMQRLTGLRNRYRRYSGPGTLDVDRLVETQRFEMAMKAQRSQLDGQRETLATEIERRRLALVEANREVRVLEKLREKQVTRHRRDENRRETKVLDEVAGRRAALEDAR